MKTRYILPETDPEGFKELLKLDTYCQSVEWMKSFIYLIKIRASQINKCAYCTNMHTNEAIKSGEDTQRVKALNTWQNSPFFTDKEKIVLEITESVTLINENGLPDKIYDKAKAFFTNKEIAQIVMAAGLINLWNRVVISSGI